MRLQLILILSLLIFGRTKCSSFNITASETNSLNSNAVASSNNASKSSSNKSQSNTSNARNVTSEPNTVSSSAVDSDASVISMIASIINSNSIVNANSTSSSSSSSPPPALIQYPYQSSDQSEVDKLIGKPSVVKSNLPVIPVNVTYNVLEQPPPPPPPVYETISFTNLSVSATNPKRHTTFRVPMVRMGYDSLTPEEQAQANLAHLTNTELKCYVAPPSKSVVSLDGLMGYWYLVRKVNGSTPGVDYKYICEEVVYTRTGPRTFNKVADVHFHGKWLTIHGNGTFISPGIVIIDWVVLDDPTVPNRLVFTVLGCDYSQWVVGYDCLTGKKKPEVVLQTRHKRVHAKYLSQAYDLIRKKKLPLDDMVCKRGFKKPKKTVVTKSHSSNKSHDSNDSQKSKASHESHS